MKTNRKPRKPDSSPKLVLKEIIGLTTKNANGLASSISSAKCAYIAGCVVVVYDVDTGARSHLMVSHKTPKPLSCVAMSKDGRFIAAGESGHQPAVLVWDIGTMAFMSELKGHIYGVECIAFSSNGEHLVSVGGYIYLWSWRSRTLITKLKASSTCSVVTSVSFSSNAKFIVTAGKQHLKSWMVGSSPRKRLNKGTGSVVMHGKPIILGLQKGSSFVSVTSAMSIYNGSWNCEQISELFPIYALTDAGVLCLIRSGLSIEKSVDLKVGKSFALAASKKLIACACCSGMVLLFTVETLSYAGSLLYSETKKFTGKSDRGFQAKAAGKSFQLAPTLPDAVACQFCNSEKLVVVYGDHSLHVWHIHDANKATRFCVLVSHSACIWDIKNLFCANMHDPSLACVARGCSAGTPFATCSADGTIRLWDLAVEHDLLEEATNCPFNNEQMGGAHLVSTGIFERDTVELGVRPHGLRSMAISSDGKYLAAGDFEGDLHVYDLLNSEYTCFQDGHDGEILSLSFSLSNQKDIASQEVTDNRYFLASGGRDRVIHLYDVRRNFDLIESIDDHSASVTSVKLACNGCKILSCSADRSLVFRDVDRTNSGYKIFRRHYQLASHGTVYDMAVDPTMEVVVTVGQDKKINTFDIAAGKLVKSFKQSRDFGDPIKVTLDPSGSYLVCSYSNKSICIYDFMSGEMVTQSMGHGEVVTGVIFLPDCRHLVSVGGDGCIFQWKIPAILSSRMLKRIQENSGPLSPTGLPNLTAFSQAMLAEEEGQLRKINPDDFLSRQNFTQVGHRVLYQDKSPQGSLTFKFSISRLPKWAQAKVMSPYCAPSNLEFSSSQKMKQAEQKQFSSLVDDGQEFASECSEHQTPRTDAGGSQSCLSRLSTSSCDIDDAQISPMNPKISSCSMMDKRWLTVYNVCLDLLNSPQTLDLMEAKARVLAPKSLRESVHLASTSSSADSSHVIDDTNEAALHKLASSNCSGYLDECTNQLAMPDTSCHKAVSDDVIKQLHSEEFRSMVQKNEESIACDLKSEGSDFFRQHFGSLSAAREVEKTKSSVRRRYSTQFVVRRDFTESSQGLFASQELSGKIFLHKEECIAHYQVDDLASNILEERTAVDSFKEDQISTQNLLRPSHDASQQWYKERFVDEHALREDQKEDSCREDKLQGTLTACREALRSLDAAAENAIRLFSKMGTPILREEYSGEAGARFYDEAAQLLPSVLEKVNAVSKLVQSSNTESCEKNLTADAGFEPILGTFAESSQGC